MLSLRERLAVVNLYEELGSYRAVAALVGCDHKTVKACLEREREARSVRQRPRATDPYVPLIGAKMAVTQGKIKSKPLLRVLRAAGYTASLRVLQRALFELRREWSREHRRIYRPWVSAPGEFLIVDWGDVGTIPTAAGRRKLLCFCAVLEPLEVCALLHRPALRHTGAGPGGLLRDAGRRAGQRTVR